MNLYNRINDSDLCKYLSSEQENRVNSIAEKKSLTMNQYLVEKEKMVSALVVVDSGELIMESVKGKQLGSLISTDELCCEDYYIYPKPAFYTVRATTATELLVYDFIKLDELLNTDKELLSRIYAAINDSLSLKTIRLTHRA